MLTLKHQNRDYLNWTASALRGAGVPDAVVGAALKLRAEGQVAAFADTYRARLTEMSAGKLAEYRIKEEIARDPGAAAEAELLLLDREAAARGLDREALLQLISEQAVAFRGAALLIGALQAEIGAAIEALPIEAHDLETQIDTTLAAAKAQADAAYADVAATINGA